MLANLFDKWAAKKQHKELAAFVANLKCADSEEIAALVAASTHSRHQLIKHFEGNPLDPSLTLVQDPWYTHKISSLIVQLQKQNSLNTAAGLMVWIHTFRAMTRLELRGLGREMWKELQRGFAKVEESEANMFLLTKTRLNIEGYDCFPAGLTPEPQ